jgi:signal recognition particle receptor subunit alpha
MRKWGDSSVTAEDMASLDYSTPPPTGDATSGTSTPTSPTVDKEALVSEEAMGVRTANGYEVADWDYRREDLPSEEEILARATSRLKVSEDDGPESSANTEGRWSSMFSRLTGKKTLTREDLQPVLAEMERHLMDKNVAKDIAEKLCDSVGTALVGKKLGGLTSMSALSP